MWLVIIVNHHYPSVFHFYNKEEALKEYEEAKGAGFAVHLAEVEKTHFDKDCGGYGHEKIHDIKTWDVEW